MSTDVGPGEIRFLDNAELAIPANDYLVTVQQQVDVDGMPDAPPAAYVFKQRIQVGGPHFGLDTADVVNMYPPAGSQSQYGETLGHVVLSRPTLPWEIPLTGQGCSAATPWMALLLLAPEEIQATKNSVGTTTVSVQEYLQPGNAQVLGPQLSSDQIQEWELEYPTTNCPVVQVAATAFTAVAPALSELPYLAHVRDADVAGSGTVGGPTGTFAVCIGNRLPTGSPTGVYIAHLVSLEGFSGFLAGGGATIPATVDWVQLISLASWTFNSLVGGGDFASLMANLDVGVLQLPDPVPEPINPAEQFVHDSVNAGYTAVPYQTRIGTETVGWYRGPFLPVQLERNLQPLFESAEAALVYDQVNGIFDLSYAVAWQTGRSLSLASRQFSVALLDWVRLVAAAAQRMLRIQELTDTHPSLAARLDGPAPLNAHRSSAGYLAEALAPRLAPSDPRQVPLLGPPGDPLRIAAPPAPGSRRCPTGGPGTAFGRRTRPGRDPAALAGEPPVSADVTGPAVLVPVTVEAVTLTMNESGIYNGTWSWAAPAYSQLLSYGSPGPAPFNMTPPRMPGAPKFTGAVIRWALPDGLTRGHQPGGAPGDVRYPDIPNRWLVVRKAMSANNSAWVYTAWLVASDYLAGPNGSQFPRADATGATTLGMSWPLSGAVPSESELQQHAVQPPLTAIGPGDPSFGAYVPNLQNVFTYGDSLAGVGTGPVSYTVCGWYAEPAADPLAGVTSEEEWVAAMTRLGWSLGNDQDQDDALEAGWLWTQAQGIEAGAAPGLPNRTVCHGQLCEVWWAGSQGPLISGVPPSNPVLAGYVRPNVAAANSAIDALAALIGAAATAGGMVPQKVAELTDIVEAFQVDALAILDKADAPAQLDIRKQQGWFNTRAGGTTWRVVGARENTAPTSTSAPPKLTGDQERGLRALNTGEHALDKCQADIAAAQWQLYALWWKANAARFVGNGQSYLPGIQAATTQVEAALDLLFSQQADLRATRDQAFVDLSQTLVDRSLIAGTQPPFYRPNDPVLLIQGARRSYQHGEDGRFSDDGSLFCRLSGQTINGLTVQVSGTPVTVPASASTVPGWQLAGLPPEITDLGVESFFLDITNAPMIASAADAANPWPLLNAIRQEQTLIWNPAVNAPLDQQTIAEASGLETKYGLGALPSKVGVELWEPPWAPLYLDWALDFYPSSAGQASAIGNNWQLPLSPKAQPLDEFAYQWTGGSIGTQNVVTLTGRTLLTPQVTRLFTARLEALIESYGGQPDAQEDMWALQDALEYLENADLLSQSLTGFHDFLLDRQLQVLRVPDLDSADSAALKPYLDPVHGPAFVADSTPAFAAQANQFNAIRAGHAQVSRLWVVDGFGQVFDVMQTMQVQPSNFTPVLSPDLTTAANSNLLEFKPRFSGFSRLNLDLLDAEDDGLTVGLDPATSPICGWLILNRLDRSLLVYDSSGNALGELLTAADEALWLPPPQSAPPPSGGGPSTAAIPNPHLRALIDGILGQQQGDAALSAFLQLIDNVSYSADPAAGWADQELPVLVGRPLAVVRGRLGFELAGGLVYGQAWTDITLNAGVASLNTYGFDQESFDVQLGSTELLDDGLVGFFLNDDYTAVNSVYQVSPADSYVTDRCPDLSFSGDDTALLTMVMDPQASLHAITGFLPPLTVNLPPSLVIPGLGSMALTFRTGPLLNSPGPVAVTLPALEEGSWSWLQYGAEAVPAQATPLARTSPTANLADLAPVLREGWMQLSAGQQTVFTYSVAPTSIVCSAEDGPISTSAFVLTIYNGTGAGVSWTQIDLSIPVGPDAASVTVTPDVIECTVADKTTGSVASDGQGNFTVTPLAGNSNLAAGQSIVATFAGVRVNANPGAAAVSVAEVTDATRSGAVTMTKVMPILEVSS